MVKTVGIAAPAGRAEKDSADRAVMAVRKLGFDVIAGESCYSRHLSFSGTDNIRARDINTMFADKRTDGIICLRGGYGSQRLMPLLDYGMIRANPKFFSGYSDITALLNTITERCGFVTYHTPMAFKLDIADGYTLSYLKRCFHRNKVFGPLENPPGRPVKTLTPGRAKGRIKGGNLSLIASSIGTDYEIETENALLFIEEVGETPEKIDRMLLHLKNAGLLGKCAGIVFGDFTDCYTGAEFKLEDSLYEIIKPLNKPAVYNLAFGHCMPTMSFPIGAEAELDAVNGAIFVGTALR